MSRPPADAAPLGATPRRRTVLALPVLAGGLAALSGAGWALPPAALGFPRDAGSHNDFATEWWYITGFIPAGAPAAPGAEQAAAYGFQITFFRRRVAATQGMASRLAARQLLFAHAAVTDVQGKKLWHDQRLARWSGEAPGRNPADTAWASTQDTDILLRDWTLGRVGGDLQARITAADFSLALTFKATQPPLLQGYNGLSRKGPDAQQASYYYSLPQLEVSGSLVLQGQRQAVVPGSTAWLDHEWSQSLLHPQAVGWDWIGINMLDGSALTAFQLRNASGGALWDGGSFRRAGGDVRLTGGTPAFARGDVMFQPVRVWHSSLSNARYPVEWVVRTPVGVFTVKATVDNQELDSRASTGAIYWEGLCTVWDSQGRLMGRGYLEMTGYAAALRL